MASGGEIPGMAPEKGEAIPPGRSMSVEQQLLDKGAGIIQSLEPVNQMRQHICTFALYGHDLSRQIETHHYVTRINQDFLQCAVYDTDEYHGHLIGTIMNFNNRK
ncbi:Oil body-associated protein 2A [Sarracenia purpurea var. burkii]